MSEFVAYDLTDVARTPQMYPYLFELLSVYEDQQIPFKEARIGFIESIIEKADLCYVGLRSNGIRLLAICCLQLPKTGWDYAPRITALVNVDKPEMAEVLMARVFADLRKNGWTKIYGMNFTSHSDEARNRLFRKYGVVGEKRVATLWEYGL